MDFKSILNKRVEVNEEQTNLDYEEDTNSHELKCSKQFNCFDSCFL